MPAFMVWLKVESKLQVTGTGKRLSYSSRRVCTAVSRVSRPGRSSSKKQEIKKLRQRAIGLKEGHVHLQLSGAIYIFFNVTSGIRNRYHSFF
jgi:hypothetical protein